MIKIYSECCICRQIREEKHLDWRYPTAQERRKNYESNITLSHGFCEECFVTWEKKELGKLEKLTENKK